MLRRIARMNALILPRALNLCIETPRNLRKFQCPFSKIHQENISHFTDLVEILAVEVKLKLLHLVATCSRQIALLPN